jgi:hypothetical protein
MRLADGEVDVAQRRLVGGDDVDVDAQPAGVHADGRADALHVVDGVQRRIGVQHDLARPVDRLAPAVEQRLDVRRSTWWPPISTSTVARPLLRPPAP